MPWINANARLPNANDIVLACMPNSCEPVWLAYVEGGNWYDTDGNLQVVTHWQPLPEPPSGGDHA